MFFVIPEMPSKTFVMLYKKLPDHFNVKRYTLRAFSSGSILLLRTQNKKSLEIFYMEVGETTYYKKSSPLGKFQ